MQFADLFYGSGWLVLTAAFGAKCGAFPNFFLYTPQVCRESFLWDANNRKCVRNRRGGGEVSIRCCDVQSRANNLGAVFQRDRFFFPLSFSLLSKDG